MSESTSLAGRHILLALSGGIACYKSAELTRLLTKAGATVQVLMSEAAEHFITAVTMQALSGRTVATSQWDAREPNNMAHINLSREADLMLIAPASADCIAKLVQGRADDLLSLTALARPSDRCPLLVAPAMNREMWAHPATQRNIAQLRADGIQVLGPAAGEQACGETGMGRMLEAAELFNEILASFQTKSLRGKHLLITAGPTFEPIDPVRGITNLSSGKMGYAIAQAAWQAGATVTLISGPTALATPYGTQRIQVQTAQQMHDAVMAQLASKPSDVFVAVAAVADWRVANASDQKLKKTGDSDTPKLEFAQNPDILASVAALKNAPYCVGFAAESEKLLEYGAAKRIKKNIPLLVGNIGHATFGSDENELVLFDKNGHQHIARADKLTLAQGLITEIAARINK